MIIIYDNDQYLDNTKTSSEEDKLTQHPRTYVKEISATPGVHPPLELRRVFLHLVASL